MKKINQDKGFTLIELLVVISIISLLASIIFASLNSARKKATDAAIKTALNNARPQAEIYFDNNTFTAQSYVNICSASPLVVGGIYQFVLNANQKLGSGTPSVALTTPFLYNAAGGGGAGGNAAVCHESGTGWAAIVSLKNPSTASAGWCVDSLGAAKESTSLPNGIIACP